MDQRSIRDVRIHETSPEALLARDLTVGRVQTVRLHQQENPHQRLRYSREYPRLQRDKPPTQERTRQRYGCNSPQPLPRQGHLPKPSPKETSTEPQPLYTPKHGARHRGGFQCPPTPIGAILNDTVRARESSLNPRTRHKAHAEKRDDHVRR